MAGFDFGVIGDAVSQIMDTDLLDIYRAVPNTGGWTLIHEGVPCHIAIKIADIPDSVAKDFAAILTSVRIHLNNGVGVQNNDYLIAKKMSSAGSVLIDYRGVCGHPEVSQTRQCVTMEMKSGRVPDGLDAISIVTAP